MPAYQHITVYRTRPGRSRAYVWRYILARTAANLLHTIYKQACAKSLGQPDIAGIRWKPLLPQTKAYRPGVPRYGPNKRRPLLTSAQDALWRAVFAKHLVRCEDPTEAARLAWGLVKARGGQTLIGLYGNRFVPIMYRTGRLLGSLKPGQVIDDRYVPPTTDQRVRLTGQRAEITFRVPYLPYQHKSRPLWPADISPWVADAMSRAVADAFRAGLVVE